MWPAAVGPVTVTFKTTADTPLPGTPPRPVTCTATAVSGLTGAFLAPSPVRVSSNRAGATGTNAPATDGSAAATTPALKAALLLIAAPEAEPIGLKSVNASNVPTLSKAGQTTRIRRSADIIPPGIPFHGTADPHP